MAIVGISTAETEDFFSTLDDAPEAEKTVWKVGAVDATIRGMIGENTIAWLQTENGSQMINKQSYRNFELCRFGLKGWERFADAKGVPIKYAMVPRIVNGRPYQVVDDDCLNQIPPQVVAELADKIMAINSATDTLRKK